MSPGAVDGITHHPKFEEISHVRGHRPTDCRHHHHVQHAVVWLLPRAQVRSGPRGNRYHEVNIERHQDGADYVMSVNGGNQTVPTVVFPDGTAATNPSLAEVRLRLA